MRSIGCTMTRYSFFYFSLQADDGNFLSDLLTAAWQASRLAVSPGFVIAAQWY